MAYAIDSEGAVDLSGGRVPIPDTVSPQARAFLATSPWAGVELPPERRPMWEARARVDAGFLAANEIARQLYPVAIEETAIAGVRCWRITPPGGGDGRVLVNLHGGGFVMGSGQLVEAIPIAAMTGAEVIAVDYRLAPEHVFPAAVEDALAVYKHVLERRAPGEVGIYGTSAGGFLTGQALARILRDGLPVPACAGIFTAGGDLACMGDTASFLTLSGFWGDLMLPRDHEFSEIRAYLGGADPADPLVSPIRGELSGFPPTLLVSGTRDALLSATCMLHRALRRAGVEADLMVYEAMPHAHWLAVHLPEAQETLQAMARFFDGRLARPRAKMKGGN